MSNLDWDNDLPSAPESDVVGFMWIDDYVTFREDPSANGGKPACGTI